MKEIREQVSIFLAESGVSAYRLAKEAGVARSTLHYLLTGKQHDVCTKTAHALYTAMREINPEAATKATH